VCILLVENCEDYEMSKKILLNNLKLGQMILRKKLKTYLFGHPAQKRICLYQSKLDEHFKNLEEWTYVARVNQKKTNQRVVLETFENDVLYAPCVQQLLHDHFNIYAEIKKESRKREIKIVKKRNSETIELKKIRNYLISNLYHQFNLQRGSLPTEVCKFIRKLEEIAINFGVFEPQKEMKVYWTIDAEAQLAYVDNKSGMSTKLFSTKNKQGLLLSETIKVIERRLNIPHIYFVPFELLCPTGRDALGNTFCNVEMNRKVLRELPDNVSIAFHEFHHDKYRQLWSRGNLTKEFVDEGIKKSKILASEKGIKMRLINRYPSLLRESFSLEILENRGFNIDMSDFIDETMLQEFSAYCRYRLLKLNGSEITSSKVWEIPVVYANPYVVGFNLERINNFVQYLKVGQDYHNSEVALMFHDKIIGFPQECKDIYNLEDGRTNITGSSNAISYMQQCLLDEKLLSNLQID